MYQQPLNYNNYYTTPRNIVQPQQSVALKGRQVSSLDEVRAAAIDFDGSIFYFPNLANDKIYTKQINLDGTSLVREYDLVAAPVGQIPQDDFVTKEELNQVVNSLAKEIQDLRQASAPVAAEEPKVETKSFNF